MQCPCRTCPRKGPCRCPGLRILGMRVLGMLSQPWLEHRAVWRWWWRGQLKAECWVMRHGVTADSTAAPRLQEKLDRGQQVPVAAAPLLPIRGAEEIPKIALHAWDAKAAPRDHGLCTL